MLLRDHHDNFWTDRDIVMKASWKQDMPKAWTSSKMAALRCTDATHGW